MNKKTMVLCAAAVALVGGITFGAVNTQASATVKQEATQVVTHYAEAISEGNADEAAKQIVDPRFATPEETLTGYKEILRDNPTQMKVVSVTAVDSKTATATMEVTTQGGVNSVDVPVKKTKDGWKIVLEEIKTVDAKVKK